MWFFFFQAEDGIRDAQESRGLGDVYKRQPQKIAITPINMNVILQLPVPQLVAIAVIIMFNHYMGSLMIVGVADAALKIMMMVPEDVYFIVQLLIVVVVTTYKIIIVFLMILL